MRMEAAMQQGIATSQPGSAQAGRMPIDLPLAPTSAHPLVIMTNPVLP